MKGQKWLVRLVLLSMAFAILFSLLRIQTAKAWSTETTGIYLDGVQQNTGTYAHATYDIFATDNKILFYDGAGALAKTWTLPNYGSNVWRGTSIITINSSFILVAHSMLGASATTYLYAWLLNVNTLAYVTIYGGTIGGSTTYGFQGTRGQAIINITGKIYFVFPSAVLSYDYAFFYELYPTFQFRMRGNSSKIFFGQTFLIPSVNETDTFYAITRHADNSTIYHIYKIDLFGSETITDIGQGGLDGDYGNPLLDQSYVYFIGYKYHQINGNEYYDAMVSYTMEPDENFAVALIRWNDTYVASDNRMVIAPDSSVARLRPFSLRYPGSVTGTNDLTDGYYNVVYVGSSYALRQQPAMMTGLDSMTPQWSGADTSTWQGKTHYYTSSNNVGGYQPSTSNVGIELDYANGKAIADLFTAPNPAWGYVYWLSPPATSQLDYDFTVTIGQGYQYYGELFIGGTLSGNGYYKIYKKINPSDPYALLGTGVVNNGQLNFTFIDQDASAYWELNLTLTDYETTYTIDHYVLGVTGTITPTPGSTIGDISGAASYGATFVVVFLPPLLILLGPALILGSVIGTTGFLGGLIIGLVIAVNTIWANVALWAIAAIVFAGVLLLLFGAGGVGTAGGTQPSIAVRAIRQRRERSAERKAQREQSERERGYLT